MENKKKNIIEAYNYRHACKQFDISKIISKEDFDFILETGRLSPSSFGFEPWKFLVVQNRVLREKLKQHTWGGQKQIPTCSHLVVTLARKSYFMKYDSEYISNFMKNVQKLPVEVIEKKSKFYREFQENDFDLLKSERAIFDWASKQTYIALGNMMTSAAMIGIDSCPIEGFDMDKVNAVLKSDFQIDTDKYGISHMVAFGYRVDPQKVKTRQAMDQITQWYE